MCRDLPWRSHHRGIHCSGVTEVAALDSAKAKGAATAGFHPMQMFANAEIALKTLPGCVVGIEADPPVRAELEAIAKAIGCVPFTVPPGVRPIYHASMYYVGPFLIALLNEGAVRRDSRPRCEQHDRGLGIARKLKPRGALQAKGHRAAVGLGVTEEGRRCAFAQRDRATSCAVGLRSRCWRRRGRSVWKRAPGGARLSRGALRRRGPAGGLRRVTELSDC
jgi:predicted short-subunit dehydrogenase-like oxidoreductase (DUF2520 family)